MGGNGAGVFVAWIMFAYSGFFAVFRFGGGFGYRPITPIMTQCVNEFDFSVSGVEGAYPCFYTVCLTTDRD
jgi:hypothetical protein